MGGVDDIVRPLPCRTQKHPLVADGFGNAAVYHARQRVPSPGLFVPPDQLRIRSVQKQELIGKPLVPHLVQLLKEPVKHIATPEVGDHRHPTDLAVARKADLRHLGDQLRRHIVHTVKADVLQSVYRPGFSRTGQAGNDQKVHSLPSLLTESCLLPAPAGSPSS